MWSRDIHFTSHRREDTNTISNSITKAIIDQLLIVLILGKKCFLEGTLNVEDFFFIYGLPLIA